MRGLGSHGRKFDLRVCRVFGWKVLEVGPAARAKVVNREFVLAARKEKFNRVSGRSLPTVVGPDEDRQVMGEIYACVLQSPEIFEGKRMYMHVVRCFPGPCVY